MSTSLIVKKTASFIGHKDCVYTAIKAYNEKTFFTGGGDGLVVLWNCDEPELGKAMAQVTNSVYAIAYDRIKNVLVVGHNFEGLHFIDLANQKEIRAIKTTSGYIFDIQIEGTNIYAAYGDGEVSIIDSTTYQKTAICKYTDKSARSIALNDSLNEIAVGYSDYSIRILDKTTLTLKTELKGHQNSVFSVLYNTNLSELISGGRDAKLRIWDCWDHFSNTNNIAAHLFAINSIDFSPSGLLYATGSMDKSIKIWDAKAHQLLKVVDKSRHAGHGTSVNKVLWLTETQLVSVSDDRTASLWSITNT